MSETQTVMRSSSSSMPASRNSPITMSRISSTSILQPIRGEYYHDSQSQLSIGIVIVSANHSPPAAAICVKRGEDPVEFVLGGVELVDAVGLNKLTVSISAADDPSVSQSLFTITEKALIRAFSWLKAATTASTFKTLGG